MVVWECRKSTLMSQQDIANLNAEDVDWQNGTETGMPVIEHLGAEALNLVCSKTCWARDSFSVSFKYAGRRQGYGICAMLPTVRDKRAWAERVEMAGMGKIRDGKIWGTTAKRAPGVCEKGADENSGAGGIRKTSHR